MELEWIALSGIGENVGHNAKQSAKLVVSLDSGDEPWYPEVAISVMVDRRADLTWEQLEEQIRQNAKAALDAASAALDAGTIAELRQNVNDRRDQIDADLARQRAEELEKSIRDRLG